MDLIITLKIVVSANIVVNEYRKQADAEVATLVVVRGYTVLVEPIAQFSESICEFTLFSH